MVALDSGCPESLIWPCVQHPADAGSCATFREPTFCLSGWPLASRYFSTPTTGIKRLVAGCCWFDHGPGRAKLNKYLAESVAVTYPLKSRFGNALGNNVQVSFISASAPAAQAAGWLRCGLAGRLDLFGTKST